MGRVRAPIADLAAGERTLDADAAHYVARVLRLVTGDTFVAFAPAQAPRVVVAVIVENAGYGAAVAVPIVRDVLRVALGRTRT